ncbi:FAD-binding oxidoreductase [Sporomusa sphaeroides]|jgi:glycolate oxidase|uniref:FAD-binding oxidoreductase n=1 Tax=Sporomusa sphaeroides TaxID=47679 RepID=UPI002C5620A9|nr:FAD-linked oxidase C-terminal domain-containing protein [Sporomusa sphaeroides]HML33072.1 FAD-linked oxidase C-terminal domain-containing protein [Sporomusa sphaeroides]
MLSDKVINELAAIVGKAEILLAPEDMIAYSHDATMFSHKPEAVVRPANRDEVAAVVRIAARHRIPLTCRGAATCLSGGAVPLKGGIVLELTRMNRIHKIDPVNRIAVVEPGVITFDLISRVAAEGLLYPPDPSSMKESTIGGNVAECAGGPKGVKYGITRNFVLGLEAVLADGSIVETGNDVDGDMCGPDWTMLFTGSEGTMAVITRISLRLVQLPQTKKTLLAIYDRLEDAALTVSKTMAGGIVPTTLEIMNDRTIVAVENYLKIGLPVNAGGLLLIEVDGVPSTVEENALKISEICRQCGATAVKLAQTAEEAEDLWRARRAIGAAFGRVAPSKFAEDSTVPRSLVPELVNRMLTIQEKYDVPVFICGHAGDGNMHPTILFDRRNKDQAERAEKALEELHFITLELGGTLSGEHGIGFAKAPFLRAEAGETGYQMGREVKTILDPSGIMNPGKMFFYEGKLH